MRFDIRVLLETQQGSKDREASQKRRLIVTN